MKKQYTLKEVSKLTPAAIDKMTPEQVLAAYNDLRGPVEKRLKALERTGYMKRHPKYEAPTTAAVTKIAEDIGKAQTGQKTVAAGTVDVERLVMDTELREKVLDLAHFVRTGPSVTKSRKQRKATIEAVMKYYHYTRAQATAMQNFFDILREQSGEEGGHVAGSDEIKDFWEDMLDMKAYTTKISKNREMLDEAFTLWSENQYEFGEIARGQIKTLETKKKAGNTTQTDENELKALRQLRAEMNRIYK